jgi:hypothetical protein
VNADSANGADKGGDGADAAAASLRIVSGDPTPAELAAVTAVLTAALEEMADDAAGDVAPVVSAWQRSQRPVRGPVPRGRGTWRGFSG